MTITATDSLANIDEIVDDHGYPTDEVLALIENWTGTPRVLLDDVLTPIFEVYGDVSGSSTFNDLDKPVRQVRFATGGWSGCEDALASLRKTFFWMLWWQTSSRGGVHIFEVPGEAYDQPMTALPQRTSAPADPHPALTYISAPTGTGVIGSDPERVGELTEDNAKDVLARVMRMAQHALAETPAGTVDEVLEDTAAVAEFMRVFGQDVRTTPTTDITDNERVLRARLVLEEALEFVEAMGCVATTSGHDLVTKDDVTVEIDPTKGIDLVEALDAIADLDVVVKGSGHTLGVPTDEAFRLVHATNMAKAPGGVVLRRADGKIQKPEGWVGPTEALIALLRERGWQG